MYESLFAQAGGEAGLRLLAEAFYRRVFADPLMLPLFQNPDEDHAGRMALWLIEFFGGPAVHTRQRGGFPTLFSAHADLAISDTQREHWIGHMLAASEEVGLDASVMAFWEPHIYFGAQAAQRHSRR
jgi:hemoglobin